MRLHGHHRATCAPRCGRHDGEGVDIEVLRKIKGYIRDVRSEEERLEAEDKMPNMVI